MSHSDSNRAFTLIELLVVIAIIAVLASLMFPAVAAIRSKVATSQALSNIRQIGLANLIYARDNDGVIIGGNFSSGAPDVATYQTMALTGNTKPPWDLVVATMKDIRDPKVPPNNSWTGAIRYAWNINQIFNMIYGRASQGISGVWNGSFNPRRMVEFDRPANLLYCTSGVGELKVSDLTNAAYLTPPTGIQQNPIYYYHGNKNPATGFYDSTPGVFLDGHVELLKYPIDPHRLNPSLP